MTSEPFVLRRTVLIKKYGDQSRSVKYKDYSFLGMVYALLVHSMVSGPSHLFYSAVFANEQTVWDF